MRFRVRVKLGSNCEAETKKGRTPPFLLFGRIHSIALACLVSRRGRDIRHNTPIQRHVLSAGRLLDSGGPGPGDVLWGTGIAMGQRVAERVYNRSMGICKRGCPDVGDHPTRFLSPDVAYVSSDRPTLDALEP